MTTVAAPIFRGVPVLDMLPYEAAKDDVCPACGKETCPGREFCEPGRGFSCFPIRKDGTKKYLVPGGDIMSDNGRALTQEELAEWEAICSHPLPTPREIALEARSRGEEFIPEDAGIDTAFRPFDYPRSEYVPRAPGTSFFD